MRKPRRVTQADFRAAGRGFERDVREGLAKIDARQGVPVDGPDDVDRLAREEVPARMSFAEEFMEALGEHVEARINYHHSRLTSGAEWANPDDVNKTGDRLQALLAKVHHV